VSSSACTPAHLRALLHTLLLHAQESAPELIRLKHSLQCLAVQSACVVHGAERILVTDTGSLLPGLHCHWVRQSARCTTWHQAVPILAFSACLALLAC
jgi:hypothetical protein